MNIKKGQMLNHLIIILILLLQSCGQKEMAKKKVVYVNSYHLGHPPTDEVTAGILENLPLDSFEIHSFFMDSKRNSSEAFIEDRSLEILDSMMQIKPDIILVSDDNAIKYLVQPFYSRIAVPVVYCGVNWSAAQYNLPENQVTGMIEVLPVAKLLHTLRVYYPDMQKLLVLNENTTTSRKTEQLLDTLFMRFGISAEHELVQDFNSWKAVFKDANNLYDIIYIQTNGAIKNWDHDEAIEFIHKYIRVPLVTCEDFMMPYVVFGLTQVSREQGIWAANTAKRILNGTKPSEIPVSRNQQSIAWINRGLADRIQFQPDSALLSIARNVDLP